MGLELDTQLGKAQVCTWSWEARSGRQGWRWLVAVGKGRKDFQPCSSTLLRTCFVHLELHENRGEQD